MKKTFTQHSIRKYVATKLCGTFLLAGLIANQANAQTIYGTINSNVLVNFDAMTPSVITSSMSITGITLGQTIEGLDFRPNTGQLYALGYNSLSTTYQVYTINVSTGIATAVNTPTILALGNGPIGFDFNPTVDRIRVVSANGANFRLHPATGLVVFTDGNLAYAATDVNVGATPKIVTAGYTNSYIGAAATSLYNYDNNLNIVTLQNPPNNGSLTTVGASGITTNTTSPTIDMDIFYDKNTSTNKAFLLANNGAAASVDELYSLNVSTGAATLIGAIGDVNPVSNIAVFIDRTMPTLTGQLAYGLSGTNLISFDTQNPSFIRSIGGITGITAGQTIVGMDFRPSNSMLYALGYNSTNNESQLYTINTASAIASVVNATPTAVMLGTVNVGLDFNPTVDKIRVVSNNDMNYRLDPTTGTVTATDANINFAATDVNVGMDPNAGSVAYTNSFGTATTTTLYNYDELLNIITTQLPPNNGTLNTVGTSGIVVNPADATVDMDIYYDPTTLTNMAYLAANTGTLTADNFYSINLSNGATTLIGKIGFGIPVKDIAIQTSIISTGLNDAIKNERRSFVSIFPNPLSENTAIYLKDVKQADVKIIDVTGRIIEIDSNTDIINNSLVIHWKTSGLTKGIYFVHVTKADGTTQVVKVIK